MQSSLLVHEQKMNRSSNLTRKEQALKASTNTHSIGRGMGKGRGRGRGQGRGRSNYRGNQQQQQEKERGSWSHQTTNYKLANKSNIECFKCHRLGHYKSECRTNLSKEQGEKSNFVEIEEEEEVCLLTSCQEEKESSKSL